MPTCLRLLAHCAQASATHRQMKEIFNAYLRHAPHFFDIWIQALKRLSIINSSLRDFAFYPDPEKNGSFKGETAKR